MALDLTPKPFKGVSLNIIDSRFNSAVTTYVFTEDEDSRQTEVNYFQVKKYEKKHGFKSDEMLIRWKAGQVFGPEYTDWLLSYMDIKDRVYVTNHAS